MFKQIVLGLLVMAIGCGIIYYSGQIVEFMGRSAWADKHLGGTKQAVVLFGFLVIIIGGLILFGIASPSDQINSIPTGS